MARKAYEMPVKSLTLVPEVDFTNLRYTFVACSATGGAIAATAGANAVGVCQEPQNVNQPMNVMFAGISFIKLGGTVASGAEVEVGAGGTAVTKASGVSQGICLVGGASGDIGCFLIK